MDHEPDADDIASVPRLREDYVAQLLFRSQLIKGGFFEELNGQVVKQTNSVSIWATGKTVLIVRDEAGVLICGLRHCEIQPTEAA